MAIDAFALILLLLALGSLSRRAGVFSDTHAVALNQVVINVCLPAAVLHFAPQLQWQPALIGVIAVPWLLLLLSGALVWGFGRVYALREDQRAVLWLGVALGNTAFLGYPLVGALLGEAALPYAVVYDQLGSFLILSTFGLWVVARYGHEQAPGAGAMALRILRFPPFIALVLALTAMPAAPPDWLANSLHRVADALLPLAALAVGISLRLRLPRSELLPLSLGLGLKLALLPALVWMAAPWLGLQGTMLQATVMEAAMPPMITFGALAIAQRLAPQLAAAMVGYGIVVAMVTVPLWAWWLQH